jgi:hypothetical protein
MSEIPLTGLRGDSPAGALALYGVAALLEDDATVRWAGAEGRWHAAVAGPAVGGVDELAHLLAERVAADALSAVTGLAKDVNELTPDAWRAVVEGPAGSTRRLIIGLTAEAPLRAGGQVALTPLCVYSFGTRGTLFGNAAKADTTVKAADLRSVLEGPWRHKRNVNTLGLDPSARRQEGATMGPDPSADGTRGVPGLLPLLLRGLAAVAPMPGTRPWGGAFATSDGAPELRWPIFVEPIAARAMPLVTARDWTLRSEAQRRAAGVAAIYAARILRDERRLSVGRRAA